MIKRLVVIACIGALSGCGLKAQTYVMTKERSDIATEGNGGYISGQGHVNEVPRKTRKVYVFELTKSIPEKEVKKIEEEVKTNNVENIPEPEVAKEAQEEHEEQAQPSQAAMVTDEQEKVAPEAKVSQETEYVIQKDDTLQKIAFKFYQSHNKWIKIYKANKDRIKNPNILRAGTKIMIPASDE